MHLITRLSHIGKTYRNLILIPTFVFAFLPISALAQSETVEEEDNKEKVESTVEEVVVSASRVPVPAEHVGSSVTVFDRNDIEKRQVRHVHEILRESPGLAISQNSLAGLTEIRMRGSENNHTMVLFDGMELADPSSSDAFYFQYLPNFSTGRIEVLRGPQSALYGSEAIGGVINITSPIPDEGTTAKVSVDYGTHNTTNLTSFVSFANEEKFVSVAMNHIKSDGISARTHNNEKDGMKQTSAHFKVGTSLSESVGITASALLLNLENDYDGWLSTSNHANQAKDKKRVLGVEVNFNQLDGNLKHTVKLLNARHNRKDYTNNILGSSKVGRKSKIEYQAAYNWETAKTTQTSILALNNEKSQAIGTYIAPGKGGEFETSSIVIEQRIDFGNDIFASLSGRYDNSKRDQFKDYKTYRGTLAWVVNDELRFHSSAGTGVKNPTVSELFGWQSDWIANPDLKPETSESWDLGAEFRTGLADLTFDLTYFNNKVTNLIGSECVNNCDDNNDGIRDAFDINFDDESRSINKAGESTIKGWELSVLGKLADTYDVTASVTFSKGFDSAGKELTRRPRQILSLNISREFTHSRKSGSINMNVQHTGNQLVGSQEQAKYSLINLGATLNLNSNLELTGNIENMFDEKYSEVPGYNKTGRTVYLGMRYTF